MSVCYLCDEPLTDSNKSIEHIVPNSIGGRLKSTQIICSACNDFCGASLDNALARIGNIFASKLKIKRERGSIPNLIATKENGEKVIIEPGWVSRRLEPKVIRENNRISIQAGTRKRLLQEFEKVKKQLEKEGFTIQGQLIPERRFDADAQKVSFDVSVDRDRLLRALAKIIASYYYYTTRDSESVKEVGRFIKSGGENNFIWFFNLHVNANIFKGQDNHVISIMGNEEEKFLYGYFELFSVFGVICILNQNYSGQGIKRSYVLNPVTGIQENWEIEFQIPKDQIVNLIQHKPNPSEINYRWQQN